MTDKDAQRIESIAHGDFRIDDKAKSKHNRTLKRVRHWQQRIWKAGER